MLAYRFRARGADRPAKVVLPQVLDHHLRVLQRCANVAFARHDVADAEVEKISTLLKDLFGLDRPQIDALLLETHKLHDESVGVHPFTRAINEELNQDQKYQIVCALWQIALADSTLDRFEEHAIRRIADLLYVPHSKFIEAKLHAKNLAG